MKFCKEKDVEIKSPQEVAKSKKAIVNLINAYIVRNMLEDDEFFVDLVLYNRLLRCFVIVEWKTGKLTHQDLGQLQMYVNYYDRYEKTSEENKTIGILLCSETSEDIARYSVLHDNDHLFMSKYLTYLPTKEQLKIEIEKQKEIYYAQHSYKETESL